MISILKDTSSMPRISLIGCGAWGKNLARNFSELGALVGVCDIDHQRAKAIALQHNVGILTEEQLLADPQVDGVAICSLASSHASQAERALRAGKHVYIEKPMALSFEEGQMLCSLAKAQNRTLMIGHILHYHPAFIALKELLPELGPLKHIYANRLALGRFRQQESILWDLACHDVSLILSLSQNQPHKIEAIGQTYLAPGKPASALLNLMFPGGLTAHVHTSWLSPFKEQKLVVIGEKGIAVFDDRKPLSEKLTISMDCLEWRDNEPYAHEGVEAYTVPLPESEPLKNECLHFLSCIQKGEEPITSGEEGLRVTKILEAAEKSLQQRMSV